jgi:transcriptional regulator with XRE-family HTH domain
MPDLAHAHRFGVKLRTLRTRQGLTTRMLAAQLGTSGGYLSNVENGKVTPNIDFAVRVAYFFNVSTDQLLRDDLDLPAWPNTTTDSEDTP